MDNGDRNKDWTRKANNFRPLDGRECRWDRMRDTKSAARKSPPRRDGSWGTALWVAAYAVLWAVLVYELHVWGWL